MALYPALEGASAELCEKWSELDDDSVELTVRACSAVWIFLLLLLMRKLQCPARFSRGPPSSPLQVGDVHETLHCPDRLELLYGWEQPACSNGKKNIMPSNTNSPAKGSSKEMSERTQHPILATSSSLLSKRHSESLQISYSSSECPPTAGQQPQPGECSNHKVI